MRECLDSLLNQTMNEIEIICFNDASPDGCLDILHKYQAEDARIVIVDSKKNIKQGGGRNVGVKIAKSDLVMFVDPDDFVAPDYVEKLYNKIDSSNADIVFCDYYQYENGLTTPFHLMGTNLPDDTEFLKQRYWECGGNAWSAIYKKRLFEDNNLYFAENLFYEDNAVMLPLILSSQKISRIDDCLYYYRQRSNSTARNKDDMRFFDRLETSIIMLNHTKRLNQYSKYKKGVDFAFYATYFRNTIFGSFRNFTRIPFDRLSEVQDNVCRHLSKDSLEQNINAERIKTRIILKAFLCSPRISYVTFLAIERTASIVRRLKPKPA